MQANHDPLTKFKVVITYLFRYVNTFSYDYFFACIMKTVSANMALILEKS